MVMAFILIVVVEGEQLAGTWAFRDITRCNTFAYFISTGKTKFNKSYQMQANVTAYCVPRNVSENTRFYD